VTSRLVPSIHLPFLSLLLLSGACAAGGPTGEEGHVQLHSGDGPNRLRIELNDEDLTADGTSTAVVRLSSTTDATGIEVTLTRRTDGGYTSFQADGVRLTDPANGWFTASDAAAKVLAAKSGETITVSYIDAAPGGTRTATRVWTAEFELQLSKHVAEGKTVSLATLVPMPPSTEDENVIAHDFGEVAQGSSEELPIALRNVGEAPVQVTELSIVDHTLDGAPFPAPEPGGPSAPIFSVEIVGHFTGDPGVSGNLAYTDVLPVARAPGEGVAANLVCNPRLAGVVKGKGGAHVDGGGWKFFATCTGAPAGD